LGKREAEWHETQNEADIYPDFITMAKSFGVPARRVIKKSELRAGMCFDTVNALGIEQSTIL
jgi:acetolactate synthase-1/2/3 large subunit